MDCLPDWNGNKERKGIGMNIKRRWDIWGKWAASYTVEAALVFPILFSVLVFLLFLTFYAHDVVVQKAVCYETALEAVHGGVIEDTGTIRCIRLSEEELFEYAQKRLSVGIIDGKKRRISINQKEKETLVSVEEQVYAEAICEELNTADFIRNIHRMQEVKEKVKKELIQIEGEYGK